MGHSFHDLIVWQKAKALATAVYRVTEQFPKHELYGLTSQIRRAAVSIAANIAEGQGRMSRGESRQFLGHARGSLFEVETHLEIAHDLGYLSKEQFSKLDEQLTESAQASTRFVRAAFGKGASGKLDESGTRILKPESRNLDSYAHLP